MKVFALLAAVSAIRVREPTQSYEQIAAFGTKLGFEVPKDIM